MMGNPETNAHVWHEAANLAEIIIEVRHCRQRPHLGRKRAWVVDTRSICLNAVDVPLTSIAKRKIAPKAARTRTATGANLAHPGVVHVLVGSVDSRIVRRVKLYCRVTRNRITNITSQVAATDTTMMAGDRVF